MKNAKRFKLGFVNTLVNRGKDNLFKVTVERSVPDRRQWQQLTRKEKASTPFGMWVITFVSTLVIFMVCLCCSQFCKPKEREIDHVEEEDENLVE